MKIVSVAAAVICDDLRWPTRIFAAARGYGDYRGFWEFPGGKLEAGETAPQALVREIREELDVTVTVGEHIGTVEYDYPNFHLSMACFWCAITEGTITLREAQDAKWLCPGELEQLPWLPADRSILPKIAERFGCA